MEPTPLQEAPMLMPAQFERVWVIQEVARAKQVTLHIGSMTIGWDVFVSIIVTMRRFFLDIMIRPDAGPKAICLFNSLSTDLQGPVEDRMDLLTLLEETRGFKSSLPSDKIYAVMGMAKDDEGVVVDYLSPPATVFENFTRQYMQNHDSIDILYHCVHSNIPATLDLPSWVPDWSRPGEVEPFRIRTHRASAGGTKPPSFSFDVDNRGLRVKGFIVERVSAIDTLRVIPSDALSKKHADSGAADEPGDRHVAFKQMSKAWLQNSLEMAFPGGEKDPADEEQLWRTFMCNRTRNNDSPAARCARGFEVWSTATLNEHAASQQIREWAAKAKEDGKSDEEIAMTSQNDQQAFNEFMGGHSRWTMNRRFFKSEAGRFGWAVDGAQVGDYIVVLGGGDHPFLMRSAPSETFTIVGDCYLHGVMEGEALQKFEEIDIVIV